MNRRLTATAVLASSYAFLGATLLLSRLADLDKSFWFDEVITARYFVRSGPRGILSGPYVPNNHELFSLLAWATTRTFGE